MMELSVIFSLLSIIANSECQSLLMSSSEICLKQIQSETEVLRSLNIRLEEELKSRDTLLKNLEGNFTAFLERTEREIKDLRALNTSLEAEIESQDIRLRAQEVTVSSLQNRLSILESSRVSTVSKVHTLEDWVAGQKSGYQRLVRLVNGGSSFGRLEVNIDGHGWGNVCDDYFDSIDATVVCRQLGYSTGVARPSAYYGQGALDIIMDDVDCSGSENAIQNCRYIGEDKENCNHNEDVGVSCS